MASRGQPSSDEREWLLLLEAGRMIARQLAGSSIVTTADERQAARLLIEAASIGPLASRGDSYDDGLRLLTPDDWNRLLPNIAHNRLVPRIASPRRAPFGHIFDVRVEAAGVQSLIAGLSTRLEVAAAVQAEAPRQLTVASEAEARRILKKLRAGRDTLPTDREDIEAVRASHPETPRAIIREARAAVSPPGGYPRGPRTPRKREN